VIGVVVAIVAILALREPNGHQATAGSATRTVTTGPSSPARSSTTPTKPTKSTSSSASSSSSTTTGAPDADKSVPLVVLNDSDISQLAADTAQQFENDGWTVTEHGNIPSGITDVISTCAYYDPAIGQAQQAAEALQREYPDIKRVKPKFDGLPDGPVVVVLTDRVSSN
jgi:hypothetical protein